MDVGPDVSVEELMGGAPASDARTLAPASPGGSEAPMSGQGLVGQAEEAAAEEGEDYDLPEPTIPLPPEVTIVYSSLSLYWSLQCEVDLKSIAFGVRNAELNPRRSTSVILRLLKPRVTANVHPCGSVHIVGSRLTEEEARPVAAKVTRMVQKCGHPKAQCHGLRVHFQQARADLRFPVRLESLAEKWRRQVMYEPEVCGQAFFFLKTPRCTVGVTAGGKVALTGFRNKLAAQEALRRTYPIFLEFNR